MQPLLSPYFLLTSHGNGASSFSSTRGQGERRTPQISTEGAHRAPSGSVVTSGSLQTGASLLGGSAAKSLPCEESHLPFPFRPQGTGLSAPWATSPTNHSLSSFPPGILPTEGSWTTTTTGPGETTTTLCMTTPNERTCPGWGITVFIYQCLSSRINNKYLRRLERQSCFVGLVVLFFSPLLWLLQLILSGTKKTKKTKLFKSEWSLICSGPGPTLSRPGWTPRWWRLYLAGVPPREEPGRGMDQVVSSGVNFRGTFCVWYFLNFSLWSYIKSPWGERPWGQGGVCPTGKEAGVSQIPF